MSCSSHTGKASTRSCRRASLGALAMLLIGGALAGSEGPEGGDWRLSVLGESAVPELPGGRQVQFRLDPVEHRASGFAGCNRFFGSYELSGEALGFGPLAATRMACPEGESSLEARFLDALARTRGWRIEGGELLLLDAGTVLARLAGGPQGPTAADLESMLFHSKVLEQTPVRLENGAYRAPAAPDSASLVEVRLGEQRAIGTLQGSPLAVTVLVTSSGGSGSYRELALLSATAQGWVNSDTVLLGDRVKVHSLAIEADGIVVAMTRHGPGDPQCCPTQEVQQRYTVRGGRLVPVPDSVPAAQP